MMDNKERTTALAAAQYPLSDNYLIQIIDGTPGSVYWKDKNGRYLGCNLFMVKTAGLQSKDDIIDKTDADLWPMNAGKIRENDLLVINTGSQIAFEEAIKLQDGTIMYFASSKMPLKDDNGNVIGIIGNSLDITKLKETERELAAAKEKAEVSNQAKTAFIQNMEHDIRTPFNGIWGLANILAERETDQEKKILLSEISTCAKELLDYCDSILDFSRTEHHVVSVLDKIFNIKELVDSVIKIESSAATHKNLILSLDINPNLPAMLIGDPYRLKRVFINLLSNAIKFTKTGYVKLSAAMVDTKADRFCVVKFIVEDTGIGIPEDKQNIIYETFTRGMPSNKNLYKGLGLGLGIVKQFITELDGDIHLESEVNKGTRFTLFLPFKLPLAGDSVVVH